jgi:hypothetical protein
MKSRRVFPLTVVTKCYILKKIELSLRQMTRYISAGTATPVFRDAIYQNIYNYLK